MDICQSKSNQTPCRILFLAYNNFQVSSFSDHHSREQHKRHATKMEEPNCPICWATLPNNPMLNQHVRDEHTVGGINFCFGFEGSCGKTFKSTQDYVRHIRAIHLKLQPFICTWDDCGLIFNRKDQLGAHYRAVHLKERDFMCGYCDMEYLTKDKMLRHQAARHPVKGKYQN